MAAKSTPQMKVLKCSTIVMENCYRQQVDAIKYFVGCWFNYLMWERFDNLLRISITAFCKFVLMKRMDKKLLMCNDAWQYWVWVVSRHVRCQQWRSAGHWTGQIGLTWSNQRYLTRDETMHSKNTQRPEEKDLNVQQHRLQVRRNHQQIFQHQLRLLLPAKIVPGLSLKQLALLVC